MEDILQRVFAIIISALVFFLLPLYIAFEKKDDISYSLALSITSNFVNDVTNKGYLTIDMYNNYISNLAVTGNSYDVSLEHVAKKYNPVIYVTDKDGNNTKAFDYGTYKDCIQEDSANNKKESKIFKLSDGTIYYNPTINYKLSEIKYTQNQILPIIDGTQNLDIDYNSNYASLSWKDIPFVSGMYKIKSGEDGKKVVYPMNVGDEFTVVIKNTNTTVATVLFSVLTLGANMDNNAKVYINYGGTIQNEEYKSVTKLEQSTVKNEVSADDNNTSQDKNDNSNGKHTITAFAGDNGRIDLSASEVNTGDSVNIVVTPNSGYYISEIVINNDDYLVKGTDKNVDRQSPYQYTLTNIDKSYTISATFSKHYVGQTETRKVANVTSKFVCIDTAYVDSSNKVGALFLSTSILSGAISDNLQFSSDATKTATWADSLIREKLNNTSYTNTSGMMNVDTSIKGAYSGSTSDKSFKNLTTLNSSYQVAPSLLNLSNVINYAKKSEDYVFCLSLEEALKYKEYLWDIDINGVDDYDSSYTRGNDTKYSGYWLRTPVWKSNGTDKQDDSNYGYKMYGVYCAGSVSPLWQTAGNIGTRPAYVLPN